MKYNVSYLKRIFTSFIVLFFSSIYAQVGINTANPMGIFNIDGAKDNPLTGVPTSVQQSNDFVVNSSGQTGIGITSPHASAMLDITSTVKGFLPPRMTNAQKNSISAPAIGLVVYCTDCTGCNTSGGELHIYTGSGSGQGWKCIGGNGGGGSVFTMNCSSAVMNGFLSAGDNPTATITINVNVTALGSYEMKTDVVDGVQFIANGVFTTLGTQTVTLSPLGTPANDGTFTWTITGGGSTCAVTSVVQKSKSTRIVKVLSLNGGYNLGTVGGSWFNNLVNNNSGEFGPSGVVKFAYVDFSTLNYNTINSANLDATFSQYDIVYFSGVGAASQNLWDNATENALVTYMSTHKSVIIMEGDDYNANFDWVTILSKINVSATNNNPSGTMYWDSPLTNFQNSPIKGTFGNITGAGYSTPNGQAWVVTTPRTDLAFLRSASTGNPIVGFWDPSNYLFYTGDDDGLGAGNVVCGITNPKSTTNCAASPYTLRGARWFANLMAFTVNNIVAKGYTTD